MTNDDSAQTASQNPEITKDILNSTFDKSDNECGSNQVVIPTVTATSSTTVACSSFYHKANEQTEQKNQEEPKPVELPAAEPVIQKPKPIGGARITRPTQAVTMVKIVKDESNNKFKEEIIEAKVEVVRREAGPRIVKPVIIVEDVSKNHDKKKKIVDNGNQFIKQKNHYYT
jgi:hypothetical protein